MNLECQLILDKNYPEFKTLEKAMGNHPILFPKKLWQFRYNKEKSMIDNILKEMPLKKINKKTLSVFFSGLHSMSYSYTLKKEIEMVSGLYQALRMPA